MIYKMNDGRQFTDYNPSCALNNFLQKKYNVSNIHDYRYYLQKNADAIQQEFLNCASKNVDACVSCPVCKQALSWQPSDSDNLYKLN